MLEICKFNAGRRKLRGFPMAPTFACVLAMLLMPCQILGQSKVAELQATVDQSNITVGDIVALKLEVRHSEDARVEFPSLGNRLGEWSVREARQGESVHDKAGRRTDVFLIHLTIYKTGDFDIPSLEVVVVEASGAKQSLSSAPIKIKVQSVLAGQSEELKDLKPQAEIPADYKPFLLFLAALVAIAVVVYQLVQYFRNRRKPLPVVPMVMYSPEELAHRAIQQLLDRKLIEQGLIKEFYLEISEIVKRYLGTKLGIASLERTTEEFQHDLKGTPLPLELFQMVGDFLSDCDLVKFAKYHPSEEETDRIVQRSFEIVDMTQQRMAAQSESVEVST